MNRAEQALKRVVGLKLDCRLTEADILRGILHPLDEGADFLGHETYVWYYALGLHYRPRKLIEIGMRFGYSLKSMILGSGQPVEAWVFDNEQDYEGSIDYVQAHFKGHHPECGIHPRKVNTRDLRWLDRWEELPEKVDLAHVDADHSEKGCYEDCVLVRPFVRPGGVILVDDVGDAGDKAAKAGADRFCEDFGLSPVLLDNYRGVYLIHV